MPPHQQDPAGVYDFYWSKQQEPHVIRRKEILEKYPQIKDLYGPDHSAKYQVLIMVATQLVMMVMLRNASWPVLFLFTYAISGTINHSLSLAVHELSHCLMANSVKTNVLLGFLCNVPQGVPSCATFKRYHMEHHLYQGVDGIDTDIPTEFEGKFFTSRPRKLLFLLMQPFAYALRPMIVRPKTPNKTELLNTVLILSWDFLVLYFFGIKSLFYLVVGTLLGMGVHPVAGHFVAEHYVFTKGQETYSYYGPLNAICFNVGYHNEHHDFPRVPGSRLPQVRAIAKEFYDPLPHYSSWTKVLWDFVMRDDLTCFSRIKREPKTMGYSNAQAAPENDKM